VREQPVTCELQGFPTNTRSRAGKSDVDDPLRRPIVGFTQNVWSEQWTSRGRILSGLADRKWPTLYSSGARTIWDLRNGALGTSAWRHTIRNDGNLRVDIPGRLLLRWPTVPLFDRIALATHGRHLRRGATGWSRCPSIALLFRWCPRRHQPAWSWLAFGAGVSLVLLSALRSSTTVHSRRRRRG